jgi:hypothetical protein
MSKILFYLTLISLVFCSSGLSAKKTNELVPQKLPKTLSYSDGFRQFWKEFAIETQGLKNLSDYVPSNTMQNKYTLVIMPDGQSGAEGFIQVTPQYFDAWTFEELGGYLVYFQEGIYKFKMPFKSIIQMLDIKGLVQIDIPRKVKK